MGNHHEQSGAVAISAAGTSQGEQVTKFQRLVLVLAFYVIGQMVYEALARPPQQVLTVMRWIDFAVCLVFLYDVYVRWRAAENKWAFWKWGWIDLLASLPLLPWLRWARLVRVFRVLLLLRSFRVISTWIYQRRTQSSLAMVALFALLLVIFSAVSVLQAERAAPDGNIRDFGSAVWWACTTITTVGYGDLYPVTPLGRALAILLMVAGVGIFGAFTAAVASVLVENRRAEKTNATPEAAPLPEQSVHDRLTQVERKLDLLIEHLRQRPSNTSPDKPS